MTEIGLSPKGACGDVVRNVTGCPLAGLDHTELIDASPLAVEIAHHLTANPAFYNLPRKFKISVTGCPLWCTYPEINDLALTAIKRGEEIGYTLRVGGGLSTEPHMAVRIPAFVPQDKALAVVVAVAEIFREQQELRENRTRARIKYLFMRHGWTAESMLAGHRRKAGLQAARPTRSAALSPTRPPPPASRSRRMSRMTFTATTSALPGRSSRAFPPSALPSCADGFPATSCTSSPPWRRSTATATCAQPSCRTSWSST